MKIGFAVVGFVFGLSLIAIFGGILGGGGPQWFAAIYLFLLIPANIVGFALAHLFGLPLGDWGIFAALLALTVPIFYACLGGYIGAKLSRRIRRRAQAKESAEETNP